MFEYIQERNFKLTEEHVQRVTYQIASSLQYLHSFGIVHRDLKLENIIMSDKTDDGVPKLVDFGLPKIVGPTATADEPSGTLATWRPKCSRRIHTASQLTCGPWDA